MPQVETEAETDGESDTDVDADIDTRPSVNCGHALPARHWTVPELSLARSPSRPLSRSARLPSRSRAVADFRLVPCGGVNVRDLLAARRA